MLRGARRIGPMAAAADGTAAATSTEVSPPASDAAAPEEAAAGGSRDNATRASKGNWRSLGGGQQAQAAAAGESIPQGGAGPASDVVVLDVRNGYEWDAGHFQGAVRPLEVSGTIISLCQRCLRKKDIRITQQRQLVWTRKGALFAVCGRLPAMPMPTEHRLGLGCASCLNSQCWSRRCRRGSTAPLASPLIKCTFTPREMSLASR